MMIMKNTNNSTPISRGHLPSLSSHRSRQVLQGDDKMTKSMIQIKAELNMFSFSVDNRPYYWECKVCGNKFKTERSTYSHIDRKDHTKPVTKEMDRIIAEGGE